MNNPRAFIDKDAVDHAAEHRPTESVQVRYRGEVTGGRYQRITVEQARIREGEITKHLDEPQKNAAQDLYKGWLVVVSPVMPKGMSLFNERVDGGTQPSSPEHRMDLRRRYDDWVNECRRLNEIAALKMVRSVICVGLRLREAEREARIRNGTAKTLVIKGLDVYCDLHGMRG